MDSTKWILVIVFISLNIAMDTTAVYCGYKTPTGVTQHTWCVDVCCTGANITFEDVCCRYMYHENAYIGCGLAVLVITSFCVCFVRACYKNRRTRQERESLRQSRRNDMLPTISSQVQPPQPPPYDLNPPPYYAFIPGTSTKTDGLLTVPKDAPPAYTLYDTVS